MKSVRPVAIAAHLWDAFGRMAEEMGSDREALVNQAMHLYARLHGFVAPGTPPPSSEAPPPLAASDRRAVTEQVLEAAERLERAMTPRPVSKERSARRTGSLVLVREDGAEVLVGKDRFVIGRGRHCDLVIDSGKISREHAAFVREGDGWIVEDLGSANGTWFDKARVQRRAIADGDELFVCAEKLTCLLR